MTLAPVRSSATHHHDSLDASIRGRVIRPGDPDFEAARRGHNLSYDARPALIVRVADARDVATAIGFARRAGLEIAVRSGGHSVAGHSSGDDILVIDLSALTGLHVDPHSRVVRAEAGLTAGQVTAAIGEHGLAIPFGDTGTVGIAGLTLGGGIGYLARKHGLAIDNLIGAELVTADGAVRTVSQTQDPRALLGDPRRRRELRRRHPVRLPSRPGRDRLRRCARPAGHPGGARRAHARRRGGTDELTVIADVMPAPAELPVPSEWVGRLVVLVTGVFAGDPQAGAAAFAPIRSLAEPVADLLGPMPYPAIYAFTEAAGTPAVHLVRSAILETFDEAAVHTALAAMASAPSPFAIFQLRALGAAVARVPADATAFAHRDTRFFMAIITYYEGDPDAPRAWTEGLLEALRPLSRGVYVNFLANEGAARVREAFPSATHARLAAVKAAVDPANVFRRNQNIRPARQSAVALR